jgi:hypothetical protein
MRKNWMHVTAVLAMAAAVLIAIVGADSKHPEMNPTSAVALAIVGYTLFRMGEKA